MSFRDDREALYAQVMALRAKLEVLEAERDERDGLADEVTALRAQLAVCEVERDSAGRVVQGFPRRAHRDSLPPMEGPATDPMIILGWVAVAVLFAMVLFALWIRA